MRNVEVAAACLSEAGATGTPSELEQQVRLTFAERYPGESYSSWNVEANQARADNLIRGARGSSVNVVKLIQDLWPGTPPDPRP